MKWYFCDCPQSLRLHENGKLGEVALRKDVEPILNNLQNINTDISLILRHASVKLHSRQYKQCGDLICEALNKLNI